MDKAIQEGRAQGIEFEGRTEAAAGEPRLVIRELGPADKDAMRVALDRLTPESSYRRFMCHRSGFTDREVAQLTDPDGIDHVAVCAVLEGPDGASEIVGTARYFRFGAAGDAAEPAIMVVDGHQGIGLGRLLFRRLLSVAQGQGIRTFECELLATNTPMKRLLDSVSGGLTEYVQADPGCVVARIPTRADAPLAEQRAA